MPASYSTSAQITGAAQHDVGDVGADEPTLSGDQGTGVSDTGESLGWGHGETIRNLSKRVKSHDRS
ncbi:hypothetical protein [Krasilnikovia cinnamomea]|uniref:hypothetical protein n=1 Tax=Krasilnikovia cinnamomea TaxID=349313 RepID=UPI001A91356E|nr:hypothetical protein [Krasilnikovia cinnamomea]